MTVNIYQKAPEGTETPPKQTWSDALRRKAAITDKKYACYRKSTLRLSFAWFHVDVSPEWEAPWWGSGTEPSLKCLCVSHGETEIMTVQLGVWARALAFPPSGNTARNQGPKPLTHQDPYCRERGDEKEWRRGENQRARTCNLFRTLSISSVSDVTLMRAFRTVQRV